MGVESCYAKKIMSDTPKTDIMVTGNCTPSPDEYEELAAFTRQIERELGRAKELLYYGTQHIQHLKGDLAVGWRKESVEFLA